MKLKTLQLLCRFCNKKCGEYQYPDNVSIADLGIVDVRCEQHKQEFGSYSKMEQDFNGLGTHAEFLTIIKKADYKKDKFDAEVQKVKMLEPVLGSKLGNKLNKKSKKSIIKK